MRGIYGDPSGAMMVLEAIGGAPKRDGSSADPSRVARSTAPAPVREAKRYRGRCGNGSHPPSYVGRGHTRRMIEEGSEGCSGEVAEGAPPDGVAWSRAVALRTFQRTNAWPSWFQEALSASIVAAIARGVGTSAEIDQINREALTVEPVSNPLRLCARCLERQASAPDVDKIHAAIGDVYIRQPGLCHHGQRTGECWACRPCAP